VKDFKKTILGKEYTVRYVSSAELGGNMGDCCQTKATIRISKDISREQQDDTLIHEVLHIIDHELILNLPEETVGRLAVALYSLGVRLG
jgi:hypothetical protein